MFSIQRFPNEAGGSFRLLAKIIISNEESTIKSPDMIAHSGKLLIFAVLNFELFKFKRI